MVSRGEGSAVVALILEGLAILFMFIFFNFEHLSSAYFVQWFFSKATVKAS